MDRLEKIVEQMESGKLPLEDLIVRYEEGMNLVKVCQERLAKAEQKIEIIARNSSGKAIVRDFEPTPEPAAPAPPPENTGARTVLKKVVAWWRIPHRHAVTAGLRLETMESGVGSAGTGDSGG